MNPQSFQCLKYYRRYANLNRAVCKRFLNNTASSVDDITIQCEQAFPCVTDVEPSKFAILKTAYLKFVRVSPALLMVTVLAKLRADYLKLPSLHGIISLSREHDRDLLSGLVVAIGRCDLNSAIRTVFML